MTPRSADHRSAEFDSTALLAALDGLRALRAMTQVRPSVLRADALAAPPGPLSGLAYVAKDVVDAVGYATTGGTPALQDAMPERDATVVARMRAAGAVLAGKTNLHELSFGITSNNAAYGAVRNPFDHSRIAGGSSGGSAAAVAAGVVPVAIAADTGGSSRIPAALCGVVGWRPTHGRYPSDGILPISLTRDTVGLCAESVAMVASVDRVLADHREDLPALDRPLRIGSLRDLGGPVDPAVASATEAALAAARGAGHETVAVDLAPLMATSATIGLPIALHEFAPALAAYLEQSMPDRQVDEVGAAIASPDVRAIWAATSAIDRATYEDAMTQREGAVHDYARLLDSAQVDLLLYPTTPATARPVGEDETIDLAGGRAGTFDTYTRYGNVAGVLGHPAISLPAGLDDDGLPIGIELAARVGDDALLLAAATALEPLLPARPVPDHP